MTEYIEREAAIDAIMKVYVRTAGYKARERVFEAKEAVHRLPVARCGAGGSVRRLPVLEIWQERMRKLRVVHDAGSRYAAARFLQSRRAKG